MPVIQSLRSVQIPSLHLYPHLARHVEKWRCSVPESEILELANPDGRPWCPWHTSDAGRGGTPDSNWAGCCTPANPSSGGLVPALLVDSLQPSSPSKPLYGWQFPGFVFSLTHPRLSVCWGVATRPGGPRQSGAREQECLLLTHNWRKFFLIWAYRGSTTERRTIREERQEMLLPHSMSLSTTEPGTTGQVREPHLFF